MVNREIREARENMQKNLTPDNFVRKWRALVDGAWDGKRRRDPMILGIFCGPSGLATGRKNGLFDILFGR
jgi:hypothetical protein